MTEEQAKLFAHLEKEYNLIRDDDFFQHQTQRWVIVTRTGIEKIQNKCLINVRYTLERCDDDMIVVKAIGEMEGGYRESYGESNHKNTKNSYPVATAEKRALGRVVLKLVGAYTKGVFSEDEV